jgi:phytoene dehydrogenase-like protein
VDAKSGVGVTDERRRHGVTVHTDTPIHAVATHDNELVLLGDGGFQSVQALVLVVTGVRPDTTLAAAAGIARHRPTRSDRRRPAYAHVADVYPAERHRSSTKTPPTIIDRAARRRSRW